MTSSTDLTQQQKLQALIERAIEGGWDEILTTETWKVTTDRGLGVEVDMISPYTGNHIGGYYPYQQYIFDHEFAKALFGTKESYYRHGGNVEFYDFSGEDWQYHIMLAVISRNPINYLYDAVFKGEE